MKKGKEKKRIINDMPLMITNDYEFQRFRDSICFNLVYSHFDRVNEMSLYSNANSGIAASKKTNLFQNNTEFWKIWNNYHDNDIILYISFAKDIRRRRKAMLFTIVSESECEEVYENRCIAIDDEISIEEIQNFIDVLKSELPDEKLDVYGNIDFHVLELSQLIETMPEHWNARATDFQCSQIFI